MARQMTAKDFDKLSKRDFTNGAVLDEIHSALKEREKLCRLLPKIIEAAEQVWIQPEYDCPGDTPELCGYQCGECKGFGDTETTIEHKAGCFVPEALALLPPAPGATP